MQRNDLHQKFETSLYLKYQMKQSLHILEMSRLDLQEYIQENLQNNPLLNYELPLIGSSENLDTFCHADSIFTDSIDFQIRSISKTKKEYEIFSYLLQNMDGKGFLICGLDTLSSESLFTKEELYFAQKKLQAIEPYGICFSDLRDFFLFHLKKMKKKHSLSYQIISHHYDLLQKEHWSFFQKNYRLNRTDLLHLLNQELKGFIPVAIHNEKFLPYQPVDIYFHSTSSGWEIEYNRKDFPKISIEKKKICKEMKVYFSQAKHFIDHLNFREQNLLKLAQYFLKEQILFFENLSDFIPLSIEQCAAALQLHPSTIFRLMHSKTFSCPRGIFAFKQGFSNTKIHHHRVTKYTLEELLKQFVLQENKKAPLTDLQLMKKFQEHQISCSRRTVAKYRKKLRISPARHRKIYS